MDVKEAVGVAKSYLADLLSDEDVTNVGLEEIERSGSVWQITLGFSRPWDYQRGRGLLPEPRPPSRSYKVFRVDDASGAVVSVKERSRTAAN